MSVCMDGDRGARPVGFAAASVAQIAKGGARYGNVALFLTLRNHVGRRGLLVELRGFEL
jgi:hypothetical protein